MREHKGPLGRRAKGGTDNDWPRDRQNGVWPRDSEALTRRGGSKKRETKKQGGRVRRDGCCCMRRMHYGIIGREWPFQSFLRVTQVAPRVCGANGKATLRSMGCSVNSQRYTSLPPSVRRPGNLYDLARASGCGCTECTWKVGEFRVDFSSVKVWLAAISFR